MRNHSTPSDRWRAQHATGRGGGAPQRSSGRAIVATIAAAGLGFGASLYPLPATLDSSGISPPQREASDFPTLVESAFANHRITNTSAFRMSDLVHLAQVLDGGTLEIRADTLLQLVNTYGLPDVVRSLEMLQSIQSETRGYPTVFNRAGGGGWSSGAFPGLVTMLEYMLEILPGLPGPQLAEIITSLLPVVAQSLGLVVTPAGSPLEAQVFKIVDGGFPALAEPPPPPPPPPPTVAPPPPVQPPAPAPPPAAPVPPAPEPITTQTVSPPITETSAPPAPEPVPSPIETPEPSTTEESTPDPEPVFPDGITSNTPEPDEKDGDPPDNGPSGSNSPGPEPSGSNSPDPEPTGSNSPDPDPAPSGSGSTTDTPGGSDGETSGGSDGGPSNGE